MLAADRFDALLTALDVPPAERAQVLEAAERPITLLGQHYGAPTAVERPWIIGAWHKDTAVHPVRDVDVLVTLPPPLETPSGVVDNLPLELLHDLKAVLRANDLDARLRQDGLGIRVQQDHVSVEVYAGFARGGGLYDICDAGGGRFRRLAPAAERDRLDESDRRTRGCTRVLVRLLKAWQGHRGVPIASVALEWFAIQALLTWSHEREGSRYYDWMVRDAFVYIDECQRDIVDIPDTGERLTIGTAWSPLVHVAREHAVKACEFEAAGRDRDAWWEWEKIFGDRVPL